MANKGLGTKIIALRERGLSYKAIQSELGCSLGTISYHLGPGQQAKSASRQRTNRTKNAESVVTAKGIRFQTSSGFRYRYKDSPKKIAGRKSRDFQENTGDYAFTTKDVFDKLGDDPVCYLTGDALNLANPAEYEFDHVVPRSKGGTNDLSNLGVASREANRAKGALSLDDFISLCEKVARNFGRI